MKNIIKLTLAASAVALLAACGGGGGTSSSNVGSELSGTVAVGAPIRGATVQVIGPQGVVLAQTQSGADGKYSVQLPVGAQGPFVIKASYADESIYSVHTGQGGVANVSHLTDAVTAMLSPNGAADGFVINSSALAALDSQQVNQAVTRLQAAVAPASSLISDLASGANFLTTAFDANGTGIDRLLDSASLTVTAKQVNGAAATNIGVAFNVGQGLNQLNTSRFVAFDSTDTAEAISSKVLDLSFNSNQLPPSTVGQMYLDLIDRLNTCYAIPRAQRVNGDVIVSQACKDVFYNADPTTFLDAGFNARQRFSSLFTASGTIQFTPTISPIIAHDLAGTGASGKALVAAKGQDDLGNYSYNRFYVRTFTLDGQQILGIEGDQNQFEFYVNSENEYRTFPLSSLNLDYIQSQFALIVRVPTNLQASATRAIVEGPGGRFEMQPITGRDNFRICRQIPDGEQIPSQFLTRLETVCNDAPLLVYASEFVDTQVTRPLVQSPLEFDFIENDFFIVRDQNRNLLSDAAIEQIPNGAPWKATIFFNNGSNEVVYTRNAGRPMTSAELRGADSPMVRSAQFASLTLSEGANKQARQVDFTQALPLTPNTGIPAWNRRNEDLFRRGADGKTPVWAPVEGGFQFDWTVNNSQIPPFLVFVSGQVRIDWNNADLPIISNNTISKNIQSFEDSRRFRVAARSIEVFCSPTQAVTRNGVTFYDESCDANLDSNNQFSSYVKDSSDNHIYNPGTRMTNTSLISRDQQQRNITRGYYWFIPTKGGRHVEVD